MTYLEQAKRFLEERVKPTPEVQSGELSQYLEALRQDAAESQGDPLYLPPPPPRSITETAGPDRGAAWAAWWGAVEKQRRRGIVGKAHPTERRGSDEIKNH